MLLLQSDNDRLVKQAILWEVFARFLVQQSNFVVENVAGQIAPNFEIEEFGGEFCFSVVHFVRGQMINF